MLKKVFILLFLILSMQASAQAFTHISGFAALRLVSKKQTLECDQAIVIEPGKAVFSALDDMGAEMFRVIFDDSGMVFSRGGAVLKSGKDQLKKLISLPISQAEFLKIIRYEMPNNFEVVTASSPQTWKRSRGKPLEVVYKSFITVTGKKFPNHVLLKSKGSTFELRWIDVTASKVKDRKSKVEE